MQQFEVEDEIVPHLSKTELLLAALAENQRSVAEYCKEVFKIK